MTVSLVLLLISVAMILPAFQIARQLATARIQLATQMWLNRALGLTMQFHVPMPIFPVMKTRHVGTVLQLEPALIRQVVPSLVLRQ
jgi:hypothetical protein